MLGDWHLGVWKASLASFLFPYDLKAAKDKGKLSMYSYGGDIKVDLLHYPVYKVQILLKDTLLPLKTIAVTHTDTLGNLEYLDDIFSVFCFIDD